MIVLVLLNVLLLVCFIVSVATGGPWWLVGPAGLLIGYNLTQCVLLWRESRRAAAFERMLARIEAER